MQAYEAERFDPPAPVALVTVKSEQLGVEIPDVPMLIDTGADVSLLPRSHVQSLASPGAKLYELEAFDGTKSTAPAVTAELQFLGKTFRFCLMVLPSDGWNESNPAGGRSRVAFVFSFSPAVVSASRCPPDGVIRHLAGAMWTSREIREQKAALDRFSLAEIRRWMADESNLQLWSAVYDVLGSGWGLIKPEPDMDETCAFMTRYLLRCIHENLQNDDTDVPTGYEAAYDLAACLKHWASKLPETHLALTEAAEKITNAYRAADDAERDRLLNGMLEHALEMAAVRPFFRQWKDDPVLGEAWWLGIEWAVSHGNSVDR